MISCTREKKIRASYYSDVYFYINEENDHILLLDGGKNDKEIMKN